MVPIRKNIPKKVQLEVFRRDNWHCRYCGRPIFFNPTLNLLEKLNPDHIYYHPHGKSGSMLSLFQWSMGSVDHIKPVARGGTNDLENFVTACWYCNHRKREKMTPAQKMLAKKESKWDGFSGLYPNLLKSLGRKEDEWVRLLRNK